MKNLFGYLLTLAISTTCVAQSPLAIPPSISGEVINLEMQNGMHEFTPGIVTNTMGVNGNVLGPTLIIEKGQQLTLNVENNIDEVTTMHWHGMHVAPSNDGGPHTTIAPGETWSPSFIVMDNATTFWYHPHLHEHTDEHVSKGIAGLIIVKDEVEALLDLPRDYGVDDFPIVIQTKDFDAAGQIISHSNSDDVVMVNATVNPYLDAPAQVVRLRLLNGSSQRVFNVGLDNGDLLYQIGSDGGLLASAFPTTRVRLAPGERAEVLVDLNGMQGESIALMSFNSELPSGMYGATTPGMAAPMTLTGYNPNELNGSDFQLLDIQIGPATTDPVLTIPEQLVELNPIPESQADITRNLTFTPETMGPSQLNGNFLINGVSFDMEVINYEIPLGNTEIWNISNQTGISHPFHLHDVQFFILDINGIAPPQGQQGLKDVVLIPQMGTVRFITVFEDFADTEVPYMYHCHMLPHEDGGMMGQFLVIEQAIGIDEHESETIFIYPNPSTGIFTLHSNTAEQILGFSVYDAQGRKVLDEVMNSDFRTIDLTHLPSGLFEVRIQSKLGFSTERLIKE